MAVTAKLLPSIWLGLICLLLLSACRQQEPVVAVSLGQREALPAAPVGGEEQVVDVCVGSMVTPLEGYLYYQKLFDYLGKRLGLKIRAMDPSSYDEVNRRLKSGEAKVGFVCGGPYVDGKENFGLQLLAAPVVNGRAEYRSYLIVPADSPAQSLADLRGKRFAFVDPKSNTGFIVPSYQLARMGETPESFFSAHLFTAAHDRTIRIVADRLVDGGAIASTIWDYLVGRDPDLLKRVRIIDRSPFFGVPPVVSSPAFNPELRQAVRSLLLDMHQDPEGRPILEGMGIERFVPGDDTSYDGIRQMRQYLLGQGTPGKET